jgi:hypothetical protein
MFNEWLDEWQRSFTDNPFTPVQLRFLLRTTVECDARDYILRLAVLSSPHFSDAGFKEILLKRLVNTIYATEGEIRKRAMLYFCVLCAVDGELITVAKAGYK